MVRRAAAYKFGEVARAMEVEFVKSDLIPMFVKLAEVSSVTPEISALSLIFGTLYVGLTAWCSFRNRNLTFEQSCDSAYNVFTKLEQLSVFFSPLCVFFAGIEPAIPEPKLNA